MGDIKAGPRCGSLAPLDRRRYNLRTANAWALGSGMGELTTCQVFLMNPSTAAAGSDGVSSVAHDLRDRDSEFLQLPGQVLTPPTGTGSRHHGQDDLVELLVRHRAADCLVRIR